jgi:hypothetical protein
MVLSAVVTTSTGGRSEFIGRLAHRLLDAAAEELPAGAVCFDRCERQAPCAGSDGLEWSDSA